MPVLSLDTLADAPGSVVQPAYDVGAVKIGIIHLGLGAFHRAHQAVCIDTALRNDPSWGISGVSLKTPRATQTLARQDGLYTLLEKNAAGTAARVIGSVRELLFLGTDRVQLMLRFADPAVRVASLTGLLSPMATSSRPSSADASALSRCPLFSYATASNSCSSVRVA